MKNTVLSLKIFIKINDKSYMFLNFIKEKTPKK